MKVFVISAFLVISALSFAHDEGHGPKLGDQPKFGGRVAAVIDKKEVRKGTSAELLYKAELTKNNKNVVRVYLYDKEMNPLKLDGFKGAKGELQFKDRKTKKWKSREFKFEKKDDAFEGELPTDPRKPFNIDVSVEAGDKTLFMAFDNLN